MIQVMLALHFSLQLHISQRGHCCWGAKVQQFVRSVSQHHQRKDLPSPVVLVLWSRNPYRTPRHLQTIRHRYTASQVEKSLRH